ncbi:hypothetical protein FNF28_06277 [Cafeteria roenbergensis]|uniref:SAP domain-containing protein n=1 Tax=Cafeteria roenbergensis TaxID=33653 RepID=A0A5A8CZH5_CAFRO|nr:hypothetical protein FNF28_06277 [Cafeteria roenbergensis]
MADVDLESLSYNELRSLAKQRGLHAGGKKVEILERLVNSAPSSPKRAREDEADPDSPPSDGEDERPAKRMATAAAGGASPGQAAKEPPATPAEPASAATEAACADDDLDAERDVVQVVQHSTGFAPPLPHAASMAGKCPDELFRRTEAVPPLYWSPVPGHVAKRAKERAASQLQPSSRRSGPDDE